MPVEFTAIRVLLIEDNPLDAKLLFLRLESAGVEKFRIHHVTSIHYAKELLDKEDFDLVLVDMTLPDSIGFETFEAVRGIAPDAAIVPLTGLDDEELALKTIHAGAQDYLVKGQFSIPQLMKAIRRAIERNEMVKALKESQARYRILIENALGFIVTHDLDGNLLSVNAAAARSLGYEPEETIGKNLAMFMQEEYRPILKEYLKQILTHSSDEGIIHLEARNGDKQIWEYRNLLYKHGNEKYVISFANDITERKKMETELKETNQRLSNSLQELQQRTVEGAILSEMTDLLLACQSSEDVYSLSINTVQQLFDNTFAGAIYELAPDQSNIKLAKTWGEFIPLQDQFPADSCRSIQSKKMYRSNQTESHCLHAQGTKSISTLCIPLSADQQTFGSIYFERSQPSPEGGIGKHYEALAITIAEQLRLALANVQLREDLRNQAIRDPLTGLFNRRYLMEWLDRELLRTSRYERPLSIAFLDIDNFKKINDTYGHFTGDEVLRQLGKMVRSVLRRSDIKSRYGGEEFVLVFPETSISDAKTLAEKIRMLFHEIRIETESGPLQNMSISIGISAYPDNGSTVDELLTLADRAVYKAKNAGKNCVVVMDTKL